MKKVIAFAGSNSQASINKQLASHAASLIKDANVSILDLNDFELPIYSIDIESANGIHPEAVRFKALIEESDAIILSLAEHNGNFSAAFKNLYDWLSRIDIKVWSKKPMLLMATSPGGRGGSSVLSVARTGFPFLGGNIVAEFSLPSFHTNFSNEITDETLKREFLIQVQKFQDSL